MSGENKFVYHDANRCMACHSCEVSCKMEHKLPAGVGRIYTVAEGPVVVDGSLKYIFKHKRCMQCVTPPCIPVCPTGAILKREDGVVYMNHDKCTGCGDCAEACPYDAIDFHPVTKLAEICDLCVERLDEGLPPFCVLHCMSGALFFGTKEEFEKRKQELAARGGKS